MEKLEISLSNWILRHRILLVFVSLIAVGVMASGGRFLHFENDYRVYFGDDNPELIAFENLETTYTKSDTVLFVVSPKSGQIFEGETLAILEEITDAAWQIPHSIRVDSITNFQHTEAEFDDLVVGDLVYDARSLSEAEVLNAREIAINDPILRNLLIAADGRTTGVNVTLQVPGLDQATETTEVVDAARQLAREFQSKYPNIEIRMTGMIMMSAAFDEAAKNDLATIVPFSFGVMFLVLAFLVGGFWGTLIAITVVFLSILSGMGVGGSMGLPITAPSSGAPTIILTVAIANCVHVLAVFRDQMRAGLDRLDAIRESLRVNLQPIILASLTTAIGFMTLNFSDVPPFRHLGIFVAIGVLVSGWLSLTLLPSVLSWLPINFKQASKKSYREIAMANLGDFVVTRRKPLLIGMTFIVILLTAAIPRNELNDIFVNYFDESIAFRADTDYATEHLSGVYNVHFDLQAAEAGGISDPEFLFEIEEFTEWLEQQPAVMHVTTISNIFKRLNKNMHGDDESYYRLPEERNLAAQYLLLYEMSLPYGLDLNNQINVDKSATKLSATLETISTKEFLAFTSAAENWLDTNAEHIEHSGGTSTGTMFAKIGDRNIKSMLVGTSLALVLISVILVFALRSVKIGLISLVPNLVPAALGFGLWALWIGEVGLSLSVVTSMTLGIVVDDTVHYLSKYLRARRELGLQAPDAVRYAFKTVGMALVTTTLILVIGFLILSTSAFELNSGMGLLTAIVISFALLADFLLLPPLLIALDGEKHAKQNGEPDEKDTTSSISNAAAA